VLTLGLNRDIRLQNLTPDFCWRAVAKSFVEAAVQSLYDDGKLKPGARVYPLLGFSDPLDPRSDTITIHSFLDHTGGYDDSSVDGSFDPAFNMRTIALELGLTHPVAKLDVARYMYGRLLDFIHAGHGSEILELRLSLGWSRGGEYHRTKLL